MASNLIQVIYTSAAVEPMGSADLRALLVKAWQKNHQLGITGMLVYNRQNFLQVLEGTPEVVDPLYAVIEDDQRHDQIQCLVRRQVGRRDYAEWSMGSVNIDGSSDLDPWAVRQFATIVSDYAVPAADVVRWFERVVEHHRADIVHHS